MGIAQIVAMVRRENEERRKRMKLCRYQYEELCAERMRKVLRETDSATWIDEVLETEKTLG